MNKISIVMTTYNGSQFILEQLESLRLQQRAADEVIILDDCSTDRTVQIIRQYIQEHGLEHWQFHVNAENLGWRKNFKKGLDMATGDYIFTCDQDDIWYPDKIAKMAETMDRNPGILLLTCNYRIFSSNNAKISIWTKNGLKDMKSDGSVEPIPFDTHWIYIKHPGCSFCFRKALYAAAEPYWNTDYAHDEQLYRWALLKGGLYQLHHILFDFRRHGGNATGNESKSRSARLNDLHFHEKLCALALDWAKENRPEILPMLHRCSEFTQLRLQCVEQKKLPSWIRLFFHYRDGYWTWKGCLLDLFYALF